MLLVIWQTEGEAALKFRGRQDRGDELQTEGNNLGDGCGNEVRYLGAEKFINRG